MAIIRAARMSDVVEIVKLINSFAKEGLLLPRSLQSVYENLLAFRVIEEEGKVVGTAGLHVLDEDMAEVRSLVISSDVQGKGYGRWLVEMLFDEAEALEVPQVLALTYQEEFFARCGFHVVDKMVLQRKIWKDCAYCTKFPACDEVAMIKNTSVTATKSPFEEALGH